MIREGKYIHIRSVEEASTVIDYYKQLGFITRGLTLDNCLEFPYLGVASDGHLISGWRDRDNGVISFESWFDLTICAATKQLDDAEISQIMNELFCGM